jgi:hypothetical protein
MAQQRRCAGNDGGDTSCCCSAGTKSAAPRIAQPRTQAAAADAAAGPDLEAATGRPRHQALGLKPLAQRQRWLVCRGEGRRKRDAVGGCGGARAGAGMLRHYRSRPRRCTLRALRSPSGASLTAPGSMRMLSRHFLACGREERDTRRWCWQAEILSVLRVGACSVPACPPRPAPPPHLAARVTLEASEGEERAAVAAGHALLAGGAVAGHHLLVEVDDAADVVARHGQLCTSNK